MRIISGIAKGKKIYTPINKKTRPLKDMVRESIFNIILHSNLLNAKFENCIVLDLFSGIGSFGLEAISRGVKKVIFFEDYGPSVELLIKNVNTLKFNKNANIIRKNIYKFNNFRDLKCKFNLVFLDPPFEDKNIVLILKNLADPKILNSESLIIIHRHKRTIDKFDKNFKILREEVYGSSKIIFGFFSF